MISLSDCYESQSNRHISWKQKILYTNVLDEKRKEQRKHQNEMIRYKAYRRAQYTCSTLIIIGDHVPFSMPKLFCICIKLCAISVWLTRLFWFWVYESFVAVLFVLWSIQLNEIINEIECRHYRYVCMCVCGALNNNLVWNMQ